jgi:LacI family transcriptional regulator
MPKVNQQLIAEKLNISQTTVSRSFSNHPSINPETKSLVLETAARMGYRNACTRVRKRSTRNLMTVGVIIGIPEPNKDQTDSFQYVLRGITERTSTEDIVLDILYQDPRELNEHNLPRNLKSTRWKGAILMYPFKDEVVTNLSNRVSCVSIVENYRNTLVDSIDVDRDWGIFKIVEYLHSLGHTNIGFVNWKYCINKADWAMQRFGAYVEALFSLGMPFNPDWCINVTPTSNVTREEIPELAMHHMKESNVTAWVCAADHQAYHLINRLSEKGIKVPEDVSVTGFDGVEPPGNMPQLCTIKVPYIEMGNTAVNQLVRRIEQPSAPRRHVMVDGNFCAGNTTATPKKK